MPETLSITRRTALPPFRALFRFRQRMTRTLLRRILGSGGYSRWIGQHRWVLHWHRNPGLYNEPHTAIVNSYVHVVLSGRRIGRPWKFHNVTVSDHRHKALYRCSKRWNGRIRYQSTARFTH